MASESTQHGLVGDVLADFLPFLDQFASGWRAARHVRDTVVGRTRPASLCGWVTPRATGR
jgi:hypothetical protein